MKKTIVKITLFLLGMLSITSCKTNFYQVYSVETDGAKQIDNSLVFENEECKVYYNLWSNNGKVSFIFSNKTDNDIFINLGQTFFIKNGFATDYYQGRTYGEQKYVQTATAYGLANTTLKGNAFWNDNIYMEDISVVGNIKVLKKVNAGTSYVMTKEKEIVCVPAKCCKVFSYYSVNPQELITCNDSKDYPKTVSELATYSKNSSPLTFTNRIAYGFTKDAAAEKHMDNTFWISQVKNYSKKAATEKVKVTDICEGKNDKKYKFGYHPIVRQFKIGGPNKFYIYYEKR